MINENITENAALLQCIKDLCASDRDFMLISLCTTDGFPISYFSTHVSSDHADKFAAMSSTILALSDSSASQMNQGQCNITIIEATSGNTLFVKANYMGTSCVLTVVAKNTMMLAEARYKTKKLAQSISSIAK